MKAIRELKGNYKAKEPSITKLGKIRKPHNRKKPTKNFSINLALTNDQKDFIVKKAEEFNLSPATVIRNILDMLISFDKNNEELIIKAKS